MCYKEINNQVLEKKKLWQELNPEYEVIIYDDNMCREFLKNEYSEVYLRLFDFLKDGPIKADFWRICILNKYGGIYADIDIKPLVPLKKYINDDDEFVTFLSVAKNIVLNPHFIKSFPDNDILKQCINYYFYLYNIIKIPYKYWEYSIVTVMELVLKHLNIIDLSYKKTTQTFRKNDINFKFLEEKSYNACYYYDTLILLNRSINYKNHKFESNNNSIYSHFELKNNEYILPFITKHMFKKKNMNMLRKNNMNMIPKKNEKNLFIVKEDIQLFKIEQDKKTLQKDIIVKKNTVIKKKKYLSTNIIEIM